jgi:hypothetical protein
LKQDHPFLFEKTYCGDVIAAVKKFLKLNFNLKIDQILIGHLFFGQRAFAISGRDIGLVYGPKIKYYPDSQDSEFQEGPIVLIDEIGDSFDIGVGTISRDIVGLYFENILINIRIMKKENFGLECFNSENYILELYSINNYGVLRKIGLHNMEEIKSLNSKFIQDIILFNLEEFSTFS